MPVCLLVCLSGVCVSACKSQVLRLQMTLAALDCPSPSWWQASNQLLIGLLILIVHHSSACLFINLKCICMTFDLEALFLCMAGTHVSKHNLTAYQANMVPELLHSRLICLIYLSCVCTTSDPGAYLSCGRCKDVQADSKSSQHDGNKVSFSWPI